MSNFPNLFHRQAQLARLAESGFIWDVLVIGGGATGLGVALDAVSRGYSVLLVEAFDFAKGTSSRSTKLVHGGVRYLAQGNLRLVREASIERGRLLRNAPHLVKNQQFIIPLYSSWQAIKYFSALKLYDWIAGRLSMGASRFISRQKTLQMLPGIISKKLRGGVLYHDGQFDDARLAINLVQTIIEKGGCTLNYCRVQNLLKTHDGLINGVTILDTETNHTWTVRSKAVVNATGVFVDDIIRMDDEGASKTICVSQGVHIVLDRSFYSSPDALMIPRTNDGRVLFVVPWHDKVVVGTTDTPVANVSIEPVALEEEVRFILDTAGAYLVKRPLQRNVLSVFAGLRPLAVPKQGAKKTKEISRSHRILVSPSGLFTMLGGKWTTFRKMGEDMLDRIEEQLGWPRKLSTSASLPLHGYTNDVNWNDPFYYYGSDETELQRRMEGEKTWLSESLRIHKAQVEWAVQFEMARTVEDVLSRRTRALLLDAKESIRICPQVAEIMGRYLGKTEAWIDDQIHQFSLLAGQYLLKQNHQPENT